MKPNDGRLHEVMVVRRNVETGQDNPKLFLVDDDVLSRLKRVRGNLYRDDPRLRLAKDVSEHKKPTQAKAEPQISPDRQAWIDTAYQQYLSSQAGTASPVTPSTATQSQTARPLTPEEEWRTRPDIRKEFASFASYAAYRRAVEAGRCKLYGA